MSIRGQEKAIEYALIESISFIQSTNYIFYKFYAGEEVIWLLS